MKNYKIITNDAEMKVVEQGTVNVILENDIEILNDTEIIDNFKKSNKPGEYLFICKGLFEPFTIEDIEDIEDVENVENIEDVEDWFDYASAKTLEEQIKYNICMATEEMLNEYEDDETKEPMTRNKWIDYIYNSTLNMKRSPFVELKHFKFYGKDKIMDLINLFLDNYSSVQEFIA